MGGRAVKTDAWKIGVFLALLTTTACARTVVKEVPFEVKVPVTVPCVTGKPQEVQALRDRMTKPEWDRLSTDQRQSLLVSQGLDRKAFGDQASVVIAGCP